jgi:hypothetical protein
MNETTFDEIIKALEVAITNHVEAILSLATVAAHNPAVAPRCMELVGAEVIRFMEQIGFPRPQLDTNSMRGAIFALEAFAGKNNNYFTQETEDYRPGIYL